MRKYLMYFNLILAILVIKTYANDINKVLSECKKPYTFVLLGATGDLSKREIYPALWYLYQHGFLPPKLKILGFSPIPTSIDSLKANVAPFVNIRPEDTELYNKFWRINYYIQGSKNNDLDYDRINKQIEKWENNDKGNRIFYMAIPPSVFAMAASQIKRACMSPKGITRIVVEKPFGKDSKSSQMLSDHLSSLFMEEQIYRMDHFLGIEMNQNLLALRFANKIFEPTWNHKHIAAVKIDFKENFGVEGRGAYFDKYGMIRDVVQNHLLQVVSLLAIERPKSVHSTDVRDAKVEFLKKVDPILLKDVVIGQYVGNPSSNDPRERLGYLDDPSVPQGSITSTFSLTVLKVRNERWSGVPFIIRAGKGLAKNVTEIIIQYKNVTNDIFNGQLSRNELVIQIVRNNKMQLKIMSKTPGMSSNLEKIEINFDYSKEFKNKDIPQAYSNLLLDVFSGSQKYFVRTDELKEAWRIFTPILHQIENKKIRPIQYKYGSTGPAEADVIERRYNFL
ncbi:PREDICTED: glucose-6-phosphate 1-dehydrogenase-like [Ceratosolen solmsi marchali]|uniref:Glucose-6-phosphate 1-dehydrogenase n=1 Tax=Ceratosolen solmsi marchali TaxID=326594 RepID=A0AAJ6YBJ5_9HYME|nr:PREDICTED: glucose-6-phosphate 1-dehydrogenase-like [Ceratosolen solmsi marchali]